MQYDTFCSFVSLVWLFSVWLSGCGSDELSAVPSRVIITSSSPSQSSYRSSSLPPYPVSFYWSEDKYPNPRDDPFGCRQPRSSLLCDPDQILDANQAQLIRDLLEQNRRSTKCFCEKCPSGEAGIKVAVALARNIDDTQYGDSSSQQFADHLRQKWRYSLCNDSLLLLMIQSYPAPKSSITTSLGRIAERLFPHQFFAEIVQNISITATTTTSNNGLGVNVVHGDNHFQLLRSMLTAITDHVEQIADPSIYQRDDHQLLAMSAVSDTDSRNSNTAIIIVAVTTGFIFFLALIVGTILIVKRRFQQEPDSELPELDPPLGYQMVPNTARKSLVPVTVDDDDHDEIDHDNNNDNDDNGSNNDEQPPTHILGDEMTPRS
ncbi:uncharacterized protein LOC113794815 [Dermatophagoides pteronyssinus]|uniref:uncharacterized protein LOC113794815 n=1 Tax=Dermatophagoides pteronyssinus TaxID=6956 RepID=UPI003F6721AE